MPVHQHCRIPRDEPIHANCGRRPGDDEAQNMVQLDQNRDPRYNSEHVMRYAHLLGAVRIA